MPSSSSSLIILILPVLFLFFILNPDCVFLVEFNGIKLTLLNSSSFNANSSVSFFWAPFEKIKEVLLFLMISIKFF